MQKKNIYYIILIWILLTLSVTSGCFSKPQAKPEIKSKEKIGLIMAETNTERNKFIKKKIAESAEQEKIKLISLESKKDPLQEKANIEKMIQEKVKAVIIQPVDTILAKDYISMLQEKNIKVILMDALPSDISVDAFISSDYLRAGELQARCLVNQGRELNVLILKGDKTNNLTEEIYQGNLNILKNNSLIKKIAVNEIPKWDQRNSYEIITKKMTEEKFNAIITHYEEIALGAIKFLKENNLDDKIPLITIGINKNYLNDIINGKVVAVDTLPNLVSQIAVETAKDLIETNSWEYDLQVNNGIALVPAKLTPVRIITKDNYYLLKERFGEIEKQYKKDKSTKDQNSGKQGGSNKQTKLKVKTKDGKEFEVTIPGEIQSVEMEPKEGQQ
ncbi:MAG: hypothetical protein PWQ67_2421 [Clostridia bacterium]|nr:hypothetical protein [Clostridia bacterium]MDN5323967.1 hypothetical protein [Clostridia bacterium]